MTTTTHLDEAPIEVPPTIIKRSAVSEDAVQAAKLAAIASSGKFKATGRVSHGNPWRSGWCGPGQCHDGLPDLTTGEPRYRCLGRAENGAKITPRYLFCACVCHTTNPAAVQIAPDDDLASVTAVEGVER